MIYWFPISFFAMHSQITIFVNFLFRIFFSLARFIHDKEISFLIQIKNHANREPDWFDLISNSAKLTISNWNDLCLSIS